MSWLYTIFVAGFLFANGSDQRPELAAEQKRDQIEIQTVGDDVVEKFDQTFPLNADGRVSLSNVNGSITIEAWDRNEVRMEATKIADSKENLDTVAIRINSKPDHLKIEVECKSWNGQDPNGNFRNRKVEVQFRLQVPRTAVLNEIESVNGSVTVSNFTNATKISAVNGGVFASNIRGSANLSTVNGEVRANFDRLDAGSSITLETVNGRVNLEVPSDINATIKADSLNGSIGNDFGLMVRKGKYVGRDLHGRIGSGEVPLHLSSVNGNLMILRKKDGKTPGSVTNLLRTTKDDDDEDDTEVSVISEMESVPGVATAMAKSARSVQRNMRETERTVKKIGPMIDKVKMPQIDNTKFKIDKGEFKNLIANEMNQVGFSGETIDEMWSTRPVSVEQRTRTFDLKASPKVNIDSSMCAVRVRGWDKQSVRYVLTEERFSRDEVLSVSENATENSVAFKVTSRERTGRPGELWGKENRFRMEVYVPRKSDVTINTEKEIRIEGVSGILDLKGSDDPVSVRNSEGSLSLNSGNGLIRVIGFKGDLKLTTGDAEVYLEGEFAKISSCADDANITLTLPQTRNASISTNTAILSDGLNIVPDGDQTWRLGSGGPKYDFEFSDGRLVVRNQSAVDTN